MPYTRPLYLTNPTMKGNDVKEVQIRLNYLGYYQSGIDCEFGLGCDKAVRQFQTNNGLLSDGSCGPATFNTLFSNSAIPRTLYLTNPTMKGDDVVRVQQKLKNLGYYTSSVDGEFGLGSKSAAIQFQTVNGLDPDGYFGPASHKKLMNNPKPNNSSGFTRALYLTNPTMKGNDVKKMQQRLKDLGYYNDVVDGEFGLNSDKAVRYFQSKNNLTQDGSCGSATWNKLFSSSAIPNINNSDYITINIKGFPITAQFVPKFINIKNNSSLKNLLADTYNGSSKAAYELKEKYRERLGKPIDIDTNSLAVEILGHVYPDKVARAVSKIPLISYLADKITDHTDPINCGESPDDANRWIWDAIAPFHELICGDIVG